MNNRPLVCSANASLTLAGAGSANEQLAASVRGKLATTEEGPSGSFLVRYRDQPDVSPGPSDLTSSGRGAGEQPPRGPKRSSKQVA